MMFKIAIFPTEGDGFYIDVNKKVGLLKTIEGLLKTISFGNIREIRIHVMKEE